MSKLQTLQSSKKATLEFKPHSSQQAIADASLEYKYLVIRAGRRFGKSSLALNIVLREALYNPGRYWIIAPEYTQAKSIYWRDLVSEYVPDNIIIKKNDNELILEIMSAVPGKNSIIEFKGSDREDKLRGAGLKGVVLDEYAFQKESVWDKVVGPMLVQTDGWAIFITTPNGVSNHFKKFWEDAVAIEANDPDQKLWKTFHFTSYDNPTIKKENLDAERARLTEEFFTQEYLAEFAKFTGLIYTGFDDKIHVREFEVDENWNFYRSIDFGATDPNAVSFIGVDKDGTIYVFDELYIDNIYTSELAELIKQKSAHRYFVATYADSAAKQSILDLGTYGIYSIPVKKNQAAKETNSKQWIIAGINRVHQLLKENKIVIHPRCKATIKEFMSYSWRKDRLGDAVNIPEDKNNHILDEFRYFVMMWQAGATQEETINYLNRGVVDTTTGY
jgi:phage terminase large subunit